MQQGICLRQPIGYMLCFITASHEIRLWHEYKVLIFHQIRVDDHIYYFQRVNN